MAYLATLGALTDELVTVITSTTATSNPQNFNLYRESALRSLRHHSFLRTNQFVVEDQLKGLEERFSVVGRDGLSNALRTRLEALSAHSTKWTPDILHFLLELSDQPAQNSKLSDLDLLREPEEDPTPSLRWEDIAKEDGWADDRGLWKDINYTDSSEDEAYGDALSEDASSDTESTALSSEETQHRITADRLVVIEEEQLPLLEQVRKGQQWRCTEPPKDPNGRQLKIPIPEAQILREVLFMLNGVSSDLFGPDCSPVPKYQLANVSWDAYRALINSFAEYGRILLPLRSFAHSKQQVPLMQVFQDCVGRSLQDIDRQIATIQERFVAIKEDAIVSLVAVLEELRPTVTVLDALSGIICRLKEQRYAHAFRYLELLFDETCMAQLRGEDSTYRFLGRIFFECFQVYVRLIRLWMEEGQLMAGDKTFFVSDSATAVPLNQVWQKQFKLRRTQDGVLHAPKFLQPAVRRIFNTGKSIVVLKHLGRYQSVKEQWASSGGRDSSGIFQDEPRLEFDAVCTPDTDFAPFSELFNSVFDLWIRSKYHTTSAALQKILFDSCGLYSSLDALQNIYFMSDGSVSESFASGVFSNLDALNPTWRDRFTLTEFAQEAWASRVDSYRISATAEAQGLQDNPVSLRRSVKRGLPSIKVHYRLAWPVQVILVKESITGYQAVFTLLLQLRRATSVLNEHRPLGARLPSAGDADDEAVYYNVRMRLLWFCNAVHTYLATLVLAPNVSAVRERLREADDVDAMIEVHSGFVKRVVDEACLGRKLDPIRDCILDVFDLAIRLEDARAAEVARGTQDLQEISRLENVSSPLKTPRRAASGRRDLYVSPREKEEEETSTMLGAAKRMSLGGDLEQDYGEVLRHIRSDFDRHLRFITGGLRGVARASSDAASGKWDILAEMLEMGIVGQR
ncbi:Spindle pole body component [Pleurostoma richardsiae]|uniref:Spindle pole body component n=1 Tax=Pleurostoma richardsiae TaxID=41990 RepID=A0AA38VR74_9PEZI|nr:Spindle pole body component [Pleurostoma richardsiae]